MSELEQLSPKERELSDNAAVDSVKSMLDDPIHGATVLERQKAALASLIGQCMFMLGQVGFPKTAKELEKLVMETQILRNDITPAAVKKEIDDGGNNTP